MPQAFLVDEWVRAGATITAAPSPPAGMPLSNLLDPQPRVRTRLAASSSTLFIDLGAPRDIDVLGIVSSTLRNENVAWRVGPRESVIEATPALAFSPVNGPGALPGSLTSTRTGESGTGEATYFDVSGSLMPAAAGAVRETYDPATLACEGIILEPPRTNSVRNPRCEGAAAKSRGAPPTNWQISVGAAGLDWKIVGIGTDSGVPYLDLRVYGTTSASASNVDVFFDMLVSGSVGQTWTSSAYYKLIAGSMAGGSLYQWVAEQDGSGNWLNAATSQAGVAPDGTLRRSAATRTLTNAATGRVLAITSLYLPFSAAVDVTIRIGGPQLEQASSPSAYQNTTGTAGATNKIRNSSNGGSANGTNGSAPTNWGANGFGGVQVEAVGSGTENGMSYVDLRAFGTAAGGLGAINVLAEPFTTIVAASGQTWCTSFFVKRVAGSLGAGAAAIRTTETTATGVLVGTEADTAFTLPGPAARLSASRASAVRVLTGGATVARTNGAIVLFVPNGAVDVTIRVACPQIEQGSFPTMPILPPVGSPAATSRSYDRLNHPISASSAYTLFCEVRHGPGNAASPDGPVWLADSGTGYVAMQATAGSAGAYRFIVYRQISATSALLGVTPNFTPGTVQRIAFGVAPNDVAAVHNGAVAVTSAIDTPTVNTFSATAADTVMFLRRVAVYRSRLTNGQMAAITTNGVSTLDTASLVASADGVSGASDGSGGNCFRVLPATVNARFVRIDITGAPSAGVDLGAVVVGSLWRGAFAPNYGIREGRLMLDQRDRNPFTGAEFPVPALANPRTAVFTLPLRSAEISRHRDLVRKLGATRDTLWIPDTSLGVSELAERCLWGAFAAPGDEASLARTNFEFLERSFRLTERL